MKKRISFILVVIMCLALAACSNSRPDDSVKEIAPQASQMKSICELATMKCYYHNVAKYFEEDAYNGPLVKTTLEEIIVNTF